MRIFAEIVLDRKPDSMDADPGAIAEQIDDEFMPAPGQSVFTTGTEGAECEYTVTSTRTWHEENMPMRSPGQHKMSDADR